MTRVESAMSWPEAKWNSTRSLLVARCSAASSAGSSRRSFSASMRDSSGRSGASAWRSAADSSMQAAK